jgi:NTP pyrophosphatase (non-canonical NTP hydrolase)
MEINNYQLAAARTCAKIDGAILDDLHMVLGMQTEVAEIADVYKKTIAYKKPLDFVNIKEEIGDVMFYIANLCNMNDWDLREILATNISKLEARYPEKFTEELALNRNLSEERKILETIPPISGGVRTINEHVGFHLSNQSHT